MINLDVGGGYRPGDGYDHDYGYGDRVSSAYLETNLKLVRNSGLDT